MNKGVILTVVALIAAGIGWWLFGRAGGAGRGAMVHVTWQGSHRGSASLPGQVAWCPVTRIATLSAVSNDTGLMITLLESDSLSQSVHPVISPEVRDQAPHPSAIAALRWATDSGSLYGFRSVSGLVDLSRVGQRVSGSLDIRMRAPVGFDTLVLKADFRDLPVVASAIGCP